MTLRSPKPLYKSLRISLIEICLLVGLAPSLQAAPDVSASLVRLTVVEDSGAAKTGTGFVVALNGKAAFIFTAKHVVGEAKTLEVQFVVDPGQPYDGAVLQNDPTEDLTLIRVPDPPSGIRPLPISAVRPERTDGVILPGFPQRSFALLYPTATVSGYDGNRLVLSGQVAPGNSGGPVLKGQNVVGLVVSERKFPKAISGSSLNGALHAWLGDSVSLPEPVEPKQVEPGRKAVAAVPDREPTEAEMKKAFLTARGDPELSEFKRNKCTPDGNDYLCEYSFKSESSSGSQSFFGGLASPTSGRETSRFSFRRGQGWVMVD